jgi:hypothetical protein
MRVKRSLNASWPGILSRRLCFSRTLRPLASRWRWPELGDFAPDVVHVAPGTQKVLLIEHLMGDFSICGGLGEMDFKRTANRVVRAEWGA